MSSLIRMLAPGALVQHETVEPSRLAALTGQIESRGVVVPVAVAPLGDGRFMVLDGAHRTAAAVAVGLARVPCRVFAPAPGKPIAGWTHVMRERRAEEALIEFAARPLPAAGPLVAVVRFVGTTARVHATDNSHVAVHEAFHALADGYRTMRYRRLAEPSRSAQVQVTWHPPTWSQLGAMVSGCGALPAGVTRFGMTTGEASPVLQDDAIPA
ncbi:ParB/RepB/Spo0J family partition protein [Flexivirga meconopsidis]|uniref:ParB/RepB/Spo0J family partition protein n=1 Tax=Flexivirga meconopsidis TaxID=2977121 RepID=UPI0022404ED4|nr:ParB/RepB/Spo0J family partition protein [Flexivirga meconopsidis]